MKKLIISVLAAVLLISGLSFSRAEAADALSYKIEALRTQIASLTAELNSLLAEQGKGNGGYVFKRNLTIGSQGDDVTVLQKFLVGKGYLSKDNVSGYYGVATKTALAKYQLSVRISPADGYFGVITRNKVSADMGSPTLVQPTVSLVQAKAADNNVIYSDETMVVFGTNLDGDTKVYIQAANSLRYEFKSSSQQKEQISIVGFGSEVVPNGYYDLFVVRSGVMSNKLRVQYINHSNGPAIVSISPSSGPVGSTVLLTVQGFDTRNYNTVIFNGKDLTAISSTDGRSMKFIVPETAPGVVGVSVSFANPSIYSNLTAVPFTVTKSTSTSVVNVISPNGGETFQLKKNIPFSWKWTGSGSPALAVMYWFSESSTEPVYAETLTYVRGVETQTGVIPYNAGINPQPGAYKIAICDGYLNQPTPTPVTCDYSDNYFKMTAADPINYSITVLSPNTQEILREGGVYTIKWSSKNLPKEAKISISLIRSDQANTNIVSNLPASQESYQWKVTSSGNWGMGLLEKTMKVARWLGIGVAQADGYSYKIGVGTNWMTPEGGGYAGDESDKSFTISPPTSESSITVVSPNGGEVFGTGETYKLFWKVPNNIPAGSQMGVQLLDQNGKRASFGDNLKNPYIWTVPTNLPAGKYKLAVFCAAGEAYCPGISEDQSDNYFSVVSKPSINTPPSIPVSPTVSIEGQSATFAWTAVDSDKDNLVWWFNYGNGNAGGNTCADGVPVHTNGRSYTDRNTFMTSGSFTVTATVDDCRGGKSTRSVVVNIVNQTNPGEPSRPTTVPKDPSMSGASVYQSIQDAIAAYYRGLR